MPSERVQRRIDGLLDAAEQAMSERNWALAIEHCTDVLALDPENEDARAFIVAAERRLGALAPAGGERGPQTQYPRRGRQGCGDRRGDQSVQQRLLATPGCAERDWLRATRHLELRRDR